MRSAFLEGNALLECPWYHSLGDFIRGLEKNSFAALDYHLFMAAGTTATIAWLAVAPLVMAPLLLSSGHFLAGVLFAACPLIYWGVASTVSRDDSYPWWSAIPFPAAVLVIVYTIWRSALLTIVRGVVWGGPPVPLAQLRAARIRAGNPPPGSGRNPRNDNFT